MESKRHLMTFTEPILAEQGLELVDLELQREPRGQVFRVFVDREGGVDLDALSRLSRELSDSLDAREAVAGHYTLEVSSPGINRPLRTTAHFERVVGKRVRVRRSRPVDGVRNVLGRLERVDLTGVTIASEAGETVTIPIGEIDRANYVHEFSAEDFGASSRRKSSRRNKRTKR